MFVNGCSECAALDRLLIWLSRTLKKANSICQVTRHSLVSFWVLRDDFLYGRQIKLRLLGFAPPRPACWFRCCWLLALSLDPICCWIASLSSDSIEASRVPADLIPDSANWSAESMLVLLLLLSLFLSLLFVGAATNWGCCCLVGWRTSVRSCWDRSNSHIDSSNCSRELLELFVFEIEIFLMDETIEASQDLRTPSASLMEAAQERDSLFGGLPLWLPTFGLASFCVEHLKVV